MVHTRVAASPAALAVGRALAASLLVIGLPVGGSPAVAQEARDLYGDTWAATDALGRVLPGHDECGPPRPGKYVGIFYFTWLGPHGYGAGEPMTPDQGVVPKTRDDYTSPYDITRILEADPDNPTWGPVHAFHHWGEPYFGYYVSDDPWVIRRHARMLTDAGVDVIVCDVTNGLTYTGVYMTVCRVFRELRDIGEATPQIAFLANSGAPAVVRKLYDEFYSKDLYPELWFRWKGKPLILTPSEGLDEELLGFFTIRQSWAWSNPAGWFGTGKDKWCWLDSYPQNPGWHEDPGAPEQISVCVAQHPTSNIGRSFHSGAQPPPEQQRPGDGLCFAEQWRRALEVDPEFVFITGWNEWVAMRFLSDGNQSFLGRVLPAGETFFVDQYTQEYSRDIEPMRGGHGDNYYYQMVANIRRFKGVRALPPTSPPVTIDIDGEFREWEAVQPEYLDHTGDTDHRDHMGWGSAGSYVNTSGRNDVVAAKVARDSRSVYFYARTREPLTPHTDANWMLLFLRVPGLGRNWEGYQYVVNRGARTAAVTALEQSTGGWNWRHVADVRYAARGTEIELAVPRAALGIEPAVGPMRLEFKWSDNMQNPGDITDWIGNGDVAPDGRFNYVFREG